MTTDEEQESPARVTAYLTALRAWRFPPEGELDLAGDADRYSGWRRIAARRVPDSLLGLGRLVVTRIRMTGRSGVDSAGSDDLRLHLGCGEHHVPGWVNVDLAGARADLVWDLRKPLPVEPGSVQAVFHEHFLEHLPVADAVDSLRACHRLLAPGGVLRIGVPDFSTHAESYLGDSALLDELRPGRPTRMLALNEVLYEYGHRSMWDLETLQLVLEEIGFSGVAAREFGESALHPAPDSPERRRGTLYVEAVKGT